MNRLQKTQRGFGLIEVVVVTAIISAVLAAFLQAGTLSLRLLRTEKQNLEATMLAQEAMEAVRVVRDESWSANIAPLVNGTIYYPVVINGKWNLSRNNPGLINAMYARQVVFSQVFRNGTDDIASSGTADTGTRKVTVTVSWGTKQIQLFTYITDFQSQLAVPAESKIVSYEGAITDADIISFPSPNAGDGDPGQSFTTPSTAPKITRVDLLLRRTATLPSDIYIELRTTATGTILGTSQVVTASTIATSSAAWVEFRFSPEVPLAASALAYIRLRSTPSSTTAGSGSAGSLNWVHLQSSSPGPYSAGAARRYIGRWGNPLDAGEQLDQYDFGFKIYSLQ